MIETMLKVKDVESNDDENISTIKVIIETMFNNEKCIINVAYSNIIYVISITNQVKI